MKQKNVVLLLAMVLTLSAFLAGCGGKSATTAASSDGIKYNKNKVFRFVGWWPKPPLYQGNPFAGDIGATVYVMPEGLFKFVRVTDEVINELAQSYEQKGSQTVIHLKKNIKWNDGKPFTSKDVWAFYTLNNGAGVMKYITGIETPDDYTVIFDWANPAPEDKIKILLLAQDTTAEIPYHIYGKFVDAAAELLKKGTPTTDVNKKGAYGLYFDQDTSSQLDKNWQAFIKDTPKFPILTGPYMVKTVTASDMILVKNPYYWNKEIQKFNEIQMKQTDAAGSLALLKTGWCDWADFTPAKDVLESLIASNKNLVHYQVPDPASPGFVFNIQKKPLSDVNVRRAMVFALDKNKIKDVGNYFGTASKVSLTGMPGFMVDKWVPQDVKDKMTDFSYDTSKADQELTKSGWQKGSDGIWKDKNGKSYNFLLGVAANAVFANASEVAAEQLTKYGLPTKLMAVDPTIYYTNAEQPNNKYDMSVDFVDIATSFNIPWFALDYFYNQFPGLAGNFPRVEKKGSDFNKINMTYPGPDGKSVNIQSELNSMLYMSEDEMKVSAGKLAYIANENAFGAEFYRNVTGFWANQRDCKGLPFEDKIAKYNRNMPLPTSEEDIATICRYHFMVYGLYAGYYEPN